jgi:hypothetical protein
LLSLRKDSSNYLANPKKCGKAANNTVKAATSPPSYLHSIAPQINTMQNNQIPHSISLEEAIQLTSNFQATRPENMPICETFEKESVLKLLNEPGAEKFRIYYGKKENGKVCAVLVAADADDKDILPNEAVSASQSVDDEDEALILEDSYQCPYACPPESPLNQN